MHFLGIVKYVKTRANSKYFLLFCITSYELPEAKHWLRALYCEVLQ